MRFSTGFLTEVMRFCRCVPASHPDQRMNGEGLRQFFDFESTGARPSKPDPFFERLVNGKRWWEWQLNEIARTRFTGEWQGWDSLRCDYRNDPDGFRQIELRCGVKPT